MHFMVTADTDIGIAKDINQDSILVKHGEYSKGEVLMAVVCDGMGGFSKGELASATVVRAFSEWFHKELPHELESLDMQKIGGKWAMMLKNLNFKILQYGRRQGITLGTTFTGMLFADNQYVITHVGDTRAYYIGKGLKQITKDQTFVAREIVQGTMTLEQAKTDKRRNMLLQCVGASDMLEPEVIVGNSGKGTYMLCTDGFRHEISDLEMYQALKPINFTDFGMMHSSARYLIELIKQRKEKDNISVILIKAD